MSKVTIGTNGISIIVEEQEKEKKESTIKVTDNSLELGC